MQDTVHASVAAFSTSISPDPCLDFCPISLVHVCFQLLKPLQAGRFEFQTLMSYPRLTISHAPVPFPLSQALSSVRPVTPSSVLGSCPGARRVPVNLWVWKIVHTKSEMGVGGPI